MNWLLSALKERDSGNVVMTTLRHANYPVEYLMKSFGLKQDSNALTEISSQVAAEYVAALLWRDLAYSHEHMPFEKAMAYGVNFTDQFVGEDVRFYSNGEWNKYHHESSFAYNPLTAATFSASVIVISEDFAACFLVEDED